MMSKTATLTLETFLEALATLPSFRALVDALEAGTWLPVEDDPRSWLPNLNLPQAVRLPVVAALFRTLARPVLFLVDQDDRAWAWSRELAQWLGRETPLPTWPRAVAAEEDTQTARWHTLTLLAHWGRPAAREIPLVVASVAGLLQPTWPRDVFLRTVRWLRPGQAADPLALARHLEAVGYEPVAAVVAVGQFARRGGVLDIWPPTVPHPVRVDYFGDEVESLRPFDPETQRSLGIRLDVVEIPPLTWPETVTPVPLWTWFPSGSLLVVDDADAVHRAWEYWVGVALENAAIPPPSLEDLKEAFPATALALGPVRQRPVPTGLATHVEVLPRFGGNLSAWTRHVQGLLARGAWVLVVTQQARRVEEIWREKGRPGPVVIQEGRLSEGFVLRGEEPKAAFRQAAARGLLPDKASPRPTLVLFTDRELFGWAPPRPLPFRQTRPRPPEAAYLDFRPGDYVVHVDFGIGRFRGLVRRAVEDVEREYLLVEYAGGDQVFVPIEQSDRLVRYVGPEGVEPALTRLGTGMWERIKARTRRAVETVARDLLELYAKRQLARGHAFSPDTPWQQEFEARCPFDLTEDQRRAVEAVKRDMERPHPMDRLICGDAGFGKTEVALRAAFKAVMDGKQVALLAPTTVLAQQHYHTFRKRLAPYPIVVEVLSRFRSPEEQEKVLQGLAEGTVDIVIGTHRLLSPDVHFKDLGLVIIDEEHRFGVMQKEHFKRLRTQVDVLSLSATPIPRTLYMALTGVRDVSVIRTPPHHRKPVLTYVGPYDPRVLREAVRRELAREGQVFYIHNRVITLPSVLAKVKKWFPEARVAMAHGQMPEKDLAEVMARFAAGEVDILVSTSIVEAGLDFPMANTLIVEQAETFGLAQLYHLRGRVGRGPRQGYAYFFWSPTYKPPPQALERLRILAEHTELGSGFTLALHDLEMRGAGDLLGTRQHGHMAAVGYHLYTQLLAEAVEKLRRAYGMPTEGVQRPWPQWSRPAVRLDVPLPAALPPEYVPDETLRLALYRRLAAVSREEEMDALARELEDRFGPLPEGVKHLLFLVRVKLLAERVGALSIGVERGHVVVRFPENREEPLPNLPAPAVVGRYTLRLPMDAQGRWQEHLLQALRHLVKELSDRK